MEVPQELSGDLEKCPNCKLSNRVPKPDLPAQDLSDARSELRSAIPPSKADGAVSSQPTKAAGSKAKIWLIIIAIVLAVIGGGGYFLAREIGPENWRINGDGKFAYAALDELNTSLQTPIGRDEYGKCVRDAIKKVKPYLESRNAKSCPKFSEWIGKTMACYAVGAEVWNEPVPVYETTALGEEIKYKQRGLKTRIIWLVAEHCLMNAKMVMEGTPQKMVDLSKNEIEDITGKGDGQIDAK